MRVLVECVGCRERKEFGGGTVTDCFGSALAAPGFKWSDVQAKAAIETIRSLPKSEKNLASETWVLLARHVKCGGK